jgi:hypothetical protein
VDGFAGGDDIEFSPDVTNNGIVNGGTGDDTIQTAAGNDQVDAGKGNDVVLAGDGSDIVDGGPGDDLVDGQGGSDETVAGDGNDTVVTDGDDDLGAFSFEIIAPISLTADSTVVRGQPLSLRAEFPDPDSLIFFDFADGTIATDSEVTHVYRESGVYGAELTVTDTSGNTTTITRDVSITETGMQTDPSDENLTSLAVGGSTNRDWITVHRSFLHHGGVRVWFGFQSLGTFAPDSHILVYGQEGNDHVTIGPFTTRPSWLFGGDGTGDIGFTVVLLENGAVPNLTNQAGQTPLYLAIRYRFEFIARHLLGSGADPGLADKRANTPLHVAARQGDVPLSRVYSLETTRPTCKERRTWNCDPGPACKTPKGRRDQRRWHKRFRASSSSARIQGRPRLRR